MEGSESEAIFDSLNLNPQLFINEVLNTVDDLVDGAFDSFHQHASTLLKIEGTARAEDLSQGVDNIRNMIQSLLNERLSRWELYCLRHCFVVPQGFSLPKPNESSSDNSMEVDAIGDSELDTQLDSLRSKLALVEKESTELNRELVALERQSVLSNHIEGSVNEVLQSYEQHSLHEMLQELISTAPQFIAKVKNLKAKRVEETEDIRMQRLQHIPNRDTSRMNNGQGLSSETLEEFQEFIMKTV